MDLDKIIINEVELDNRFTYHAPNEVQRQAYTVIRDNGKQFVKNVASLCPNCRELSLAITKIEEAVMWANAAIARRT